MTILLTILTIVVGVMIIVGFLNFGYTTKKLIEDIEDLQLRRWVKNTLKIIVLPIRFGIFLRKFLVKIIFKD